MGHGFRGSMNTEVKSGMAQQKKNLVIVESPTKARTLAGFLGREYEVRASVGHVRDLPKSKLGVDVGHGFKPDYIVPEEKMKVVKDLKAAARGAAAVYLATDPDREGEAISWHVMEAAEIKPRKERPIHRVVFHEITKAAIDEAFRHPREIDFHLVNAQQARRVLDRLVGYKISPLLWKKIRRGLSAGRVQSVMLRMIVEREREIQNFVPREYWTIEAELSKQVDLDTHFRARLHGYVGKKKADLEIPDEATAQRLVETLRDATYEVAEVRKRAMNRRPSPPFTTSTLQQEASRRLGFNARRTMKVAQELYEGRQLGREGSVGLITYMRTDSTNVSKEAVQETRAYITRRFGGDFVPSAPRAYAKRQKNAQEAHEAIRPTSVLREPETIRRYLTPDQLKLYALIWQRMVASQMADAVFDQTSVDITATPTPDSVRATQASPLPTPAERSEAYLFRATASRLRFPGFRAVYFESRDDGVDEDADTNALPELAAGDPLRLHELFPDQHFTEPPPRYTEASLVKALEENGIGRPSTYAPIMSTLENREYVEKAGRQLRPQELGFVVTDLLTEHFTDFVDIGFTAEMEEELDDIAQGSRQWQPVVDQFYQPLEAALKRAANATVVFEESDETCPECGAKMVIRWGRFGKFLACSRYPECKGSRPLEGEREVQVVADEVCPECSSEMVVKQGRFGRFLACSRYPTCKGSRPFLTKIGVACPKDGGQIVERRMRGRGKRVFYGCSNFPNCDFTSWVKPTGAHCPQCDYLVVPEGARGLRCLRCDWRQDDARPESQAPDAGLETVAV
jgi:DNA topoisomerase-1